MKLIGALLWLLLLASGATAQGINNPLAAVYPTVTFANLPSVSAVQTGAIYNVSDVGINGSLWRNNGTKWGLVNGSAVLLDSGMPFITVSSGSIAAGGALTGITALTVAYPKAWCYLPANAVATVAAAGYRYCTFSTTTAGTVFLNTPGSTFPIIWPASPTAVTDGKGAFTGAGGGNAIIFLPTITLPASTLGINGKIIAKGALGTSSGVPVYNRIAIDGSFQAPLSSHGQFTALTYEMTISAAGATAVQNQVGTTVDNFTVTTSSGISAIDMTASHTIAIGSQVLGSAVDNSEVFTSKIILENDGQ